MALPADDKMTVPIFDIVLGAKSILCSALITGGSARRIGPSGPDGAAPTPIGVITGLLMLGLTQAPAQVALAVREGG